MPSQSNILFALGIIATGSRVAAGPCDIYAAGGTACVAAHSTTRALYSAYTGPLYQLTRKSDNTKKDVKPLAAGGVANATIQDDFCKSTTCLITTIYDQSSKGNHLTQAPAGGAAKGPEAGGYDSAAPATGAPVTLDGVKAYGVFIAPKSGYRNNNAKGIAVKDGPEGMYAVLDGTHYNGACCFDYGNAETNSQDTGNGHMEAIYFGSCSFWGSGAGKGPWIMADLENGLFSGVNTKQNTGNPTISSRFLTTIVKGKPNVWAIRGGNAASGTLSTFYDGKRPNANGYNPMSKEGAIILGIGGDNSNGAQGTFYEGVMTSGYPSDDTENKVQADIVAAKYATTKLSTIALTVGSSISLQDTTDALSKRYISSAGSTVKVQAVSSSSNTSLQQEASWIVRTGLGHGDCFSFESKSERGSYIRHYNFELQVQPNDGSKQFAEDATFCTEAGLNGQGTSIRSWNYPDRYLRHYNNTTYAASNGGYMHFDDAAMFNNEVSWEISAALA
ncbi:fungal alpha-L-arabinofuranosidase [Clohesyomyces aquaticus]|uniref:Alpha-L-arabinofuranosidase n=1 Tax=Clohesyomyces aquaticus TaxID=1231657 RepID=A0A1Y1XXY2_9PLEO|nr:fungal alpha-L-arabinofuranosidase [Clohesyomyces aquaticus]